MNIVFMGTAELAVPSLKALCQMHGHRVVGVFTQPDRPAGRNQKLTASPVKQVAEWRRIPVFQPEKLREGAAVQALRQLNPQIIVVVAYGQLLRREILDLPKFGCVNVHASLLPRWRGAAPIQWAIVSGDEETGVTTMKMDEGLDTGPILLQARMPIYRDDTAATLHDRLAEMGARLIVETVEKLENEELEPTRQDNARATHARKLSKEDGHIDWRESAEQICRKVRAFDPWPGAFCFLPSGEAGKGLLLKIWKAEAINLEIRNPKLEENPKSQIQNPKSEGAGVVLSACSDGIVVAAGEDAVRVTELQLEGRKRMSAEVFLRGHTLVVGTVLG
jgi:methionyl-tRNA formyltransferase